MRVLVSWLFIFTWMEQVGLWMGYARPCARGWNRFKYGPCATQERERMRQRHGEATRHALRKGMASKRRGRLTWSAYVSEINSLDFFMPCVSLALEAQDMMVSWTCGRGRGARASNRGQRGAR